jgi:hypothetical protein
MGPGPSETSESQIAGDTSPEQGCMARWNYEQARDDNDILGRDPAGPLAPLGGTESLLHSPPPQMVTSASPITKPPTESPTESSTESPPKPKSPFKSSPTYVHRSPTISIGTICGYDVAAGTTSSTCIFLNFCGCRWNCFCNFRFVQRDTARMLYNLE